MELRDTKKERKASFIFARANGHESEDLYPWMRLWNHYSVPAKQAHSCRVRAFFSTRKQAQIVRFNIVMFCAFSFILSFFFHLVPVDLMFIITLSRIFFHYKTSSEGADEKKGMIKKHKVWKSLVNEGKNNRKMYEQILSGVSGRCRCQVTVEGWVGVGSALNSLDGWSNSNDFCKRVWEPKHKWTRLKCQNLNCQAVPTLRLKERAKERKRWKMFLYIFHGKIYLLRGT